MQGGGYRYSVAVEQGSGKGPKRKQQLGHGPRTFGLREADDGWERIEVGRGMERLFVFLQLLC